jgi:hypothetical protein
MNSASNTYSAPPLTNYSTPASYTTPATNSSLFLGMSWTTWLIIFLILAIFGFNIFVYLAKGTQSFADYFGPNMKYFTGLIGNTAADVTKNVTNTAATGTKAGVDLVAGTVTSGVDIVQQTTGAVTGATATSSLISSQKTNAPVSPDNSGNNDLSAAVNSGYHDPTSFSADDSSSAIQSSKSSNKSGWCYIGEDRGFRSCIQVGANDDCMSGDIFPSQDICVNPNLRA